MQGRLQMPPARGRDDDNANTPGIFPGIARDAPPCVYHNRDIGLSWNPFACFTNNGSMQEHRQQTAILAILIRNNSLDVQHYYRRLDSRRAICPPNGVNTPVVILNLLNSELLEAVTEGIASKAQQAGSTRFIAPRPL